MHKNESSAQFRPVLVHRMARYAIARRRGELGADHAIGNISANLLSAMFLWICDSSRKADRCVRSAGAGGVMGRRACIETTPPANPQPRGKQIAHQESP